MVMVLLVNNNSDNSYSHDLTSILTSLNHMLKSLNKKLIIFFEEKQDFIPFSNMIIRYLKLSLPVKLILGFLSGFVGFNIAYCIGFIIVQSKGKNEVLSVITAFQNPIEFPFSLVLLYSFIFSFLIICALLPIFLFLFLIKIYKIMNLKLLEKGLRKSKRLFLLVLFIILTLLLWGLATILLIRYSPYVPYIMLYQSKEPVMFENYLKAIFHNDTSIIKTTILNYDHFYSEVLYSLSIAHYTTIVFVLLLYPVLIWYRRIPPNSFIDLIPISIAILMFSGIFFVSSTHLFYQWGNFGKSLSQFNMDYVSVEYTFNKDIGQIEGTRIFQKENYLVIRDSCNSLHYITSNEVHVTTLSKSPFCR